MRILDRYIGGAIVKGIFTVWCVLLAIFSFFAFIEELEDVGRGDYGLFDTIVYVITKMPRLAYELFPMAALIGSLITFGTLMRNGELTVMRCAGVPKYRLVYTVVRAGLLIVVIAFLVGEFLVPRCERFGADFRQAALNERVAYRSENGFWARDGDSYINIREILPGDQLVDVYIYEFDAHDQLRLSTYAKSAHHDGVQWVMKDIAQTEINGEVLRRHDLSEAAWSSLLKPDLVSMVTIKPDALSVWNLLKYVRFLRDSGQTARRYEHVLWVKLVYPFATAVMVMLAVPMVLGADRQRTVGERVLIGGLIGLGFHLLNQAAGHVGVVYDWPPMLSGIAPAVLVAALAATLLLRTR